MTPEKIEQIKQSRIYPYAMQAHHGDEKKAIITAWASMNMADERLDSIIKLMDQGLANGSCYRDVLAGVLAGAFEGGYIDGVRDGKQEVRSKAIGN